MLINFTSIYFICIISIVQNKRVYVWIWAWLQSHIIENIMYSVHIVLSDNDNSKIIVLIQTPYDIVRLYVCVYLNLRAKSYRSGLFIEILFSFFDVVCILCARNISLCVCASIVVQFVLIRYSMKMNELNK